MIRAVLSIGGILVAVWILVTCFSYTTAPITTIMPGLNRSVARTVGIMSGNSPENGNAPGAISPGQPHSGPATPGNAGYPASSPAGADNAPSPTGNSTAEAEIISPDSTAHLNSAHIHDIDQPTPAWAAPSGDGSQAFNPNPQAFVPPSPLPAHPRWTWDVGNREFADVIVTHVDADMVTITSNSGPAQIDIALLPTEIRRELNYDPVLAAQATAARKAQAAPVTTSSP